MEVHLRGLTEALQRHQCSLACACRAFSAAALLPLCGTRCVKLPHRTGRSTAKRDRCLSGDYRNSVNPYLVLKLKIFPH